MKKVVTPEQMAAADRAVIERGTPSLELMEQAGTAVASRVLRLAGGAYGRRILILCGKGNNAGDGFVAARKLRARGAFPVVALLEDVSSFTSDAAENFSRLRAVRAVSGRTSIKREIGRSDLVIDAVFGTGFKGSPSREVASLFEEVNSTQIPLVAVDIPSGVDGATGVVKGAALRASVTVTMGAIKCGLVLPPGCEFAGSVEVADIGVGDEFIESDIALVEEQDVRLALDDRPRTAHKKSVGTVLVVAGSVGMSGAAALAAKGAFRTGAGLVTMAAPASVALELDQTVLEATTLALPETGRGTIEPSAVGTVLERAESVEAVALGPGLTTDPETVEFVRKLVEALQKPLVLDADGINAFSASPEVLQTRGAPTILTPHPGEISRLLSISTKQVIADRLSACREAAKRTGCVVILKGYRSIVARPDGRSVVIATGGPALATGGTGDVLTGVAAALLASGMDSFVAAWSAAWIHGRAGDLMGGRIGERSSIAGDLLLAIAEVIRLQEERK